MQRIILFFSCLLALLALAGVAGAQGHGKQALDDDEEDTAAAPAPAAHAARAAKAHDPKPAADTKAAAAKADDGAAEDTPEAPQAPQTIKVGIRLEKLNKFEVGPGTFAAEFYLAFRCTTEPCKPDFEITNGKVNGKPDKVVDEKLLKEYRIKADLEGLVDLTEFPFDKHVLYIGLVDKSENVTYEVDEAASTIEPTVKLAGWQIADHFAVHTEKQKLEDGHEISEAQLGIAIQRPRISAFFKTLVPVLFMVFVAGFTLLLKPKSAAGRLATATGGLMSVVMFHLSSTSSLPPMGYLTRIDKFMIATYVVYLLNIAFSVAMVRFEEKKKEKYSELAYLAAAGAVPGVALIAWVAVFMRLV
jgi:hypothetical protein